MKKDLLKEMGMNAGAKPELFRFAERLRENMTDAERNLWGLLYERPLGRKFRRQHPFGKYIIDFYCHSERLAIEVDGGYHETINQKTLDENRTEYINSYGIEELRFSNKEVMEDLESVMKIIVGRFKL